MSRLLVYAIAVLAASLFVLVAIGQRTRAHESWINRNGLTDPVTKDWCCNEHDCKPERVSEVRGGYRLYATGEVIPATRVLWRSPDGFWWVCRYQNPNLENFNTARCLIGPPPAM